MSNKNVIDMNKSSDKHQHISDLLDDRGDGHSVDELLDDSKQSQTWFRYNLVRSVLHKENSAFASYDFTETLSAKIAEEPDIKGQSQKSAKVFHFWSKAASGFAIAATAAFAVIFSVEMMTSSSMNTLDGNNQLATQNEAPIIPLEISSTPVDSEQAQLDDIQRMLSQMNQRRSNVQLVGGEVMKSIVIEQNTTEYPLEEMVQKAKKSNKTKR